MQPIREWQNVDRDVFANEIYPANRPAVLKGLLCNWPAVEAGRDSCTAVVDYLKQCDTGSTVNAMVGPPETKGRFFYSDDFQRFNFDSKTVPVATALDTFVALAEDPAPHAIALQAMHVPDLMPSFPVNNPMPLLDDDVAPRMWISNRSLVAPHFDNNHNIACVVSGSRRFTVFPPEQVSNLYIGPLMKTPGGTPVSVVDLRDPDFEAFPRFREALEAGRQAVLEPGDAVYIPLMWWHGVESLEPLNVLVNYWWNDTLPAHHKPILALIHTAALMSSLPDGQRETWRTFFDYFAFRKDRDPAAHLPPDLKDALSKLSSAERDQVLAFVAERLKLLAG